MGVLSRGFDTFVEQIAMCPAEAGNVRYNPCAEGDAIAAGVVSTRAVASLPYARNALIAFPGRDHSAAFVAPARFAGLRRVADVHDGGVVVTIASHVCLFKCGNSDRPRARSGVPGD